MLFQRNPSIYSRQLSLKLISQTHLPRVSSGQLPQSADDFFCTDPYAKYIKDKCHVVQRGSSRPVAAVGEWDESLHFSAFVALNFRHGYIQMKSSLLAQF